MSLEPSQHPIGNVGPLAFQQYRLWIWLAVEYRLIIQIGLAGARLDNLPDLSGDVPRVMVETYPISFSGSRISRLVIAVETRRKHHGPDYPVLGPSLPPEEKADTFVQNTVEFFRAQFRLESA